MKYSTPKTPLYLLNLSRFSYKIVFLFLFFSAIASSQNCTVNAGVPKVICSKTSFELTGSAAFAQPFKDAPVWSQTAGSAVVLSPTDNSDLGSITSTVTGFTPGSSYTFKLQGRCQDGSTVFQTVVYTISTATVANAGADETGCPGTVITLSGNAPAPGEIVEWIRISGSGALPSSPNSPTNTVTLAAGTAGETVYRYTITGTCQTFDDVIITNTGGVTPVSAGPNQTLGNCYSVTASTTLAGSFGGDNTNGQQGTWTLVSGPSTPNIGNINSSNTSVSNLLPGTYVFRWTVVGPCVNGTSTVSVTVPPPTQTRTQASTGDLVFCDARTSVLLQGNVPKFAGETVQWVKTSGPPVMIANANSPAATITGLVAGNIYTFTYTITNASTGCTSVGNYSITYTLQPTISAPTNLFMACNDSIGTIPFTFSGGNQTEWSLISGPAGCGIGGLTGTTPFATVASSPLQLVGLTHLGTYVIRLKRHSNTGIGGCGQAFTDVTIHVTKDPAAANAGTLQVLACNVTATSLAGNNPAVGGGIGIGSWSQVSGPNTAIFTNPSLYNAPISGLTNGKYTFRYIISGGLGNCPAAQDEVTVVVSNILPTVKPAGSNQTICASAPITLAATPPDLNEIGTWTVIPSAGVVISDINNPAATVTGLDTPITDYVFTWTVANGCGTASSDVTITTNSNQGPNPSIAGPDQCLFTGDTVALAANAPVSGETGTWTASGPASVTFSNAASNTSTATFAADGNYVLTWTLTRSGSCSSTASTLTVSKFPAVSSPVTASASSTEICSLTPTLTLTGSAIDAGATGTWTQVQGAGGIVITSPNSLSTSIVGLAPGAYKFRWTVARSSCNSGFADVTVNVATPPTTAMAMADISICSGTTQVLNATVPTAGTGSWSIVSAPNTPTFSDSSSPTATISGLVSGTYVLRWTISSGPFCESSSNNVTIFVTQPATAGDNQYLCNETTTTLTGNEGTSGNWTLVSQTPSGVAPAISQSGTNGAIISGLLPATYVFRYTLPSIGACPSTTADVTVNNSGAATPANAGPDQDICLLNPATSTASVTLAANDPLLGIGTGIWTIESAPSGATPIFASTTTFNSQVTNLIPGIYVFSWAITNGNCSSALNKDEVRIIIYGDPSASTAGSTQTNACSGNVTLVGNVPEYGNGTWTQDSGPNTAIISQTNSAVTAVTGTVIGTYVFRWTISNGSPTCTSTSSTVSITVTSDPATVANAGIDQNICNNNGLTGGSTLLAGNNPTVGTGLWTKISGPGTLVFEDNTLFNTNITSGLTNGTYVLRWTITNGSCSGFDEMTITVADPPTPAVITTPTQSICLFDAVNLSANPVTLGNGQWSGTGPTIPVFLNPTSNSTSVSNLLVGEYTFVFTTSNGATCSPSVSTPITITILPLPTSSQAGPVQTACFGSYATMAANTPSTGTGTWTSSPAGIFSNINSPTSTFTGVPGVYQLTWTITRGSCTSATETQVTILPAIDNNNISGNATICSGLTATISNANPALSGGNGTTYQYAWQQSIDGGIFTNISGAMSADFTTPALTNTTAANVLYSYRRLVTSGACETANNSNNITVTVLPQVAENTLTTPTTTSFCGGSDPVAITGSAPIGGGGGGAFTYVWQFSSDGTTYANIAGETSATYDPPAFTNTGNSVLNFYYRRIATSSAGCQNTSNIIQLISNPVPLIANKTATVCGATAFSVLPTNGSDVVPIGTTYSWSAPTMGSNITGGVSATGQTSILGTLVNNGTTAQTAVYSVTATANGCPSGIFSVTVTVNPKSTIADKTATVCANSSFSVTPGGGDVILSGTTYSWSAPTGTGFSGGAAGSNANSISGTLLNTTNAVTTATYLVTASSVSFGSCPTTFPVTVTLNPRPVIANKTARICTGSTFTVAPSNGTDIVPSSTTYTWTQNSPVNLSGNSNQAVGQSSISQTLTNNTNAPITIIYTVTPTSGAAGTCVGTTFTVTVIVNPTPIVANKTVTICGGVAFTVTPTNGAGDVIPSSIRYAWSSPSGSGFSGGAALSNQTTINGTLTNTTNIPTTATYTVTPSTNTTPSCSGSNFTVTVTLNPRPRINAKTASICTGGTFAISPVNGSASDIVPAGTTYTWTQNNPSGITGNSNQAVAQSTISQTLTNSTNAAINVVYTVTPTSGAAGSCVGSTFTVTVTVNPTPIINAKSVYVCSGNALNYTPTSVSGETIPLGTNYTWTVTSVSGVSGASANSTGTTSINPILTLSDPNVAGSVVYNVTPIFATCTGNTFALNVTVNPIPSAPTAGTVTQPTCAVATSFFQITAYDNTKTYNFNPSSGVSISPTGLVTASVGSYTFTVTNPGTGGCTSSSSSSIVVNAQPSTPAAPAAGAVTQPTCASSTGTFQITSYNNARVYNFTPAVLNISATGLVTANAGTYSFTVDNAAGCTSPASSSIVVNAQPSTPTAPSVGVVSQPTCTSSAGTFQIASYDNTRTYTFTPSVVSISSTGLVTANAGTYTFTVDNAAGCTSPASSSIVVNAQPATPTAPSVGAVTQPSCASFAGTFQIASYDNTRTYTFTPSVVSISSTGLVTANAGTYTFTVNNAAGCTSPASSSIVVNAPPAIPAAPSVGTITQPTCAVNSGSVMLNNLPTGSWTINPGNISGNTSSITISGLATGTYNFTVTLGGLCVSLSTSDVIINVAPTQPTQPTVVVTAPTCATAATNILSTYSASLTYTSTPTGLSVGAGGVITGGTSGASYTITATNASSCFATSSSFTFNGGTILPTPAVPTVVVTAPTCASDATNILNTYSASLTYTSTPTGLSVGTGGVITGGTTGTSYTITATNASTCSATSASFTFNGGAILPTPAAFSVTGGGSYCSGAPGFAVGLGNSITGINYQLQLNGVNDGTAVAGTGSAISFGLKTAVGTYTVIATNTTTTCTATMTGSAVITICPLGSIGDIVWYDTNGDGLKDSGENGLVGATVRLDPGTPSNFADDIITTTDASGNYLFSNLVFGTYTVSVDVSTITAGIPAGYNSSQLVPTFDADSSVGTPLKSTIVLGNGQNNLDQHFAFVIPSDQTTGGNAGGVESESLGDAISKIYVGRKKNSVPTEFVKTSENIYNKSILKTSQAYKVQAQTMRDMFPKELVPGNIAHETSPKDILDYTIADQVLSVDFSLNGKTKAVVLGIKTTNKIYNHTKASCDRLRGAEILNIQKAQLQGYNFLMQGIKQRNGVVEYAISFAVAKNNSDTSYSIQTNWYVNAYTKFNDVYNFQVWSTRPADTQKLVSDILNNLKSYLPVNQIDEQKIPETYASKVYREKGELIVKLRSTKVGNTAEISMEELYSETANNTHIRDNTLSTKIKQELRVDIADGYEYEGLIKVNSQVEDAFYHADGNWGLDYDKQYNKIYNYFVWNNFDRKYSDEEYSINRNVEIKATSEDYLTVYKSLLPGTLSADYSEYKYLSFTAKGSGLTELGLIKSSIEDWKSQYRIMVNLTDKEQTYYVPFDAFISANSKQSMIPNDLTTLTFTFLPLEAKTKELDMFISNVKFVKVAGNDGIVISKKLKFDNSFLAYPNPSQGKVNLMLFSNSDTNAIITLSDLLGRTIHKSSTDLKVGRNELDFNFNLPSGTYIINVSSKETDYGSSKIIFR